MIVISNILVCNDFACVVVYCSRQYKLMTTVLQGNVIALKKTTEGVHHSIEIPNELVSKDIPWYLELFHSLCVITCRLSYVYVLSFASKNVNWGWIWIFFILFPTRDILVGLWLAKNSNCVYLHIKSYLLHVFKIYNASSFTIFVFVQDASTFYTSAASKTDGCAELRPLVLMKITIRNMKCKLH